MNAANHTRLAIVTLVLLPLVWLWPCVFGGNTFVPFDPAAFPPASIGLTADELAAAKAGANYDVTEVLPWLLPEMGVVQAEVARGRLPTWNPNARTGAPLHEAGVHGVFYPPHWLWLFGGDASAKLVWLTWISLLLAGVFTFGLLRKVSLSPLGSWFGAASFQLSATMIANGYFWTRLPALAWLPGLLLALIHLSQGTRLRRRPLLAVAICLAMPWYAGFPPYATAGTLLGLLFAVRLLLERLGLDGSAAARALGWRLLFAFVLGVLLTMPQVLPSFWFYATQSARSAAASIDLAAGARFEPYGLLGYLVPEAFGHPHRALELPYNLNPLCYLWGNRVDAAGSAVAPNFNFSEYSVGFGAVGVVLAAFGAIRGRGHMRWFLLSTLAMVLALALFLPVMNLAYRLPVIGNVAPMRWLAPATLLSCWLAAIGFDRLALVERRSLIRLTTLTVLLAGVVAWASSRPAAWHAADADWPAAPIAERFGISLADAHQHFAPGAAGGDRFALAADTLATAGWQAAGWLLLTGILLGAFAAFCRTWARPWLLSLLPALAVVQLFLQGAPLLRGQPLAVGTDTAVHAFLRERAAALADQGGFAIARASTGRQIPSQLPPGQLMLPGIRDLHFYTHYDARSIEPLRAVLGEAWSREAAGQGYLQLALPPQRLQHPVFDLLGLRYVLSSQQLTGVGRRVGPELRSPRGQFFVYERPHPLPRAFTVGRFDVLADDAAVLAAMGDAAVQFARVAFGSATDVTATVAAAVDDAKPRPVKFVRDEPSVVELDIAAGDAPFLVLTDTWFPGWTATIDGAPAAIERCNHAMRLLRLPAGSCRVRFENAPVLLWPGLLLFVLAIAGIVFAGRRSSGGS